jgi:hypothetical protein
MSSQTKSANLQAYRLILYRRALHPELFGVRARRTVEHTGYEFEAWVMKAAHVMRFRHEDVCATELMTDQEMGIPERGIIAAHPCAGERDVEQDFGDSIRYVSSVQTEQLPDALYRATYDELIQLAGENDAMVHSWNDDEGGRCASILDIQRYRREIHAQSYHLLSQGGLVLRTQSIFEHHE